jgi:hypothetical protein
MLKQNVGNADRVIRIVIGIALLAFAAFGGGSLRWLGLIGIIPLATAALGTCPLFSLVGLSSRPSKRES